jgi:hypothetical protein
MFLKDKLILLFEQKNKTMASLIKDTPVLNGKDAIRFLDAIHTNETKKSNSKEREKIKNNAAKFKFAN